MIDQKNLELLLTAQFPIILIETHEEPRAVELLTRVLIRKKCDLLVWSAAAGLESRLLARADSWQLQDVDAPVAEASAPRTQDPEDMLNHVRREIRGGVVTLLDFHPYLSNPRIVRLIREIAQDRPATKNTLILISHSIEVPPELSKLCVPFELTLPNATELRRLLGEEARLWKLQARQTSVKADQKALDLLIQNLRGLTVSDARQLIRNAIYNDGAITHSDVKEVQQAKYRLVDPGGILSFEYDTVSLQDVGGFARMKEWLALRKAHFLDPEEQFVDDLPKGMLLLGVQGCGKSLAAKGVAGAWGVPLLRLDFGALYNKYIGETEKNIRETLRSAEVLAPCVLWLDEIEKGLDAGDSGDSGTSRRVLGTFLTWLAENRSRVFLVATANDIQALPPELMRKGRLDEIFFVDLPPESVRREILTVHLRKRGLREDDFDLHALAAASEGFSGAEIEQAIVSASYRARAEGGPLDDRHLLRELDATRPLSVVMAEKIDALRRWAHQRTVSAH